MAVERHQLLGRIVMGGGDIGCVPTCCEVVAEELSVGDCWVFWVNFNPSFEPRRVRKMLNFASAQSAQM